MKKILTLVLAALACSAAAQDILLEAQAGEAVISLTGATEMTALQFSLKLPPSVAIDTDKATMGSATEGHTLCIEKLDSGDLLFILYSMDLNTFRDGELLRFPLTVGGTEDTAYLYTIRYASTESASHAGEDITTGIRLADSPSPSEGKIYNVSGQRLNKLQKGINIVGGHKMMK